MLSVEDFVGLHQEGYRRESVGDMLGAIECYEAALAGMDPRMTYPGVANVRGNLMQCHAQTGDINAAWEQATLAVQAAQFLPDAQKGSLFAQVAWFFGEHAPVDQLPAALGMIDEALALLVDPDVLPAMVTKMRILVRLGREAEARGVARAALAADPDHPGFAEAKRLWSLGSIRAAESLPPYAKRVEVKGLPPRPTIGMRAAYSAWTQRIFFFGGEKPASETGPEDEVRQRNTVFALVVDGSTMRWEGPIASAVEDPLENFESAVLPRSSHVWCRAANPRYLMAHGGANHDARGVTFMGQGGLADWLAFDVEHARWIQLATPLASASSLPVLVDHGAVFDPGTGRVIMLRASASESELARHGLEGTRTLTGLVFDTAGDPSEWTFRRFASNGVGPSVRAGYGIDIVGGRAVLFGGAHAHTGGATDWPDDVAVLELGTATWRSPKIRGEPPLGRVGHGVVALDDDRVLVAGGHRGVSVGREGFTTLHILDLQTERWRRVPGELHVPAGATWVGIGAGADRRVFVVGGETNGEGTPVFEIDVRAL